MPRRADVAHAACAAQGQMMCSSLSASCLAGCNTVMLCRKNFADGAPAERRALIASIASTTPRPLLGFFPSSIGVRKARAASMRWCGRCRVALALAQGPSCMLAAAPGRQARRGRVVTTRARPPAPDRPRLADLRATRPLAAPGRHARERKASVLDAAAACGALGPPARLKMRAASVRDRRRLGFEPLAHEERDHVRAQVARDV
jgi:hypothetical protein